MNSIRFIVLVAAVGLVATGQATRAAGEDRPNESGLVLSAIERNPNAVLHRPEHKDKEVKVIGIVNGMVNKLTNLSQRLENQLAQAKQRAASQTKTAKLETATQNAQQIIAATIRSLQTILESDNPATLVPEIREQIRMLRTSIEAVRAALISFNQSI